MGALALAGCQAGQANDATTTQRAPDSLSVVTLPAPRRDGTVSLESALRRRRSVRSFTDAPLTAVEIGQLLWAAQGVTDPRGSRTAPSAGALYPLECYVATPDALLHYMPNVHRLLAHVPGDQRGALAAAAYGQSAVADAAVVIVITAVYARTAEKYGEERAFRYAAMEAGHAAQNVLLQAVALGLGAVPVGAFDDAQVGQLLRLDMGEAPLYLIAVGHPDG